MVKEKVFSDKWTRWAKLMCSASVRDYIHDEFLEMFRFKRFPDPETVLDAGCGLARYRLWLASDYYGIDMSNSIDVARKNWKGWKYVHLHKGDMRRIPKKWPQEYDLVIAVGTLHHTPDTEEAFKAVAKYVKPGGTFCFSVYAKKNPVREAVDDAIRRIARRMNDKELLKFSEAITKVGKVLRESDEKLHNWFYYNVLKCFWNADLEHEFSVAVNYDYYGPRYAWRHYKEEIQRWCKEAGFKIQSFKSTKAAHWVRAKKDKGE